ncbi:MAG: putative rane protein, partial [Deltaproteobacteria bacterium]|nr:putative rane protein [Deltaproteobacteria bacterium]
LSELWSHPVQGSIQGKLDAVRFDCDRIQTKGNVAVRVFGGEALLSRLGVSGVLGSTPTLLLDATWKDMNLAELTEGTPFEKIEGILKGRVEHLEMVGNEPQRFDLFMETVKAGQEPQKISVRALENIARLGGSESPFIGLAGAFTSLFGEFPYDKIAIQASLENDVFRIDGPLREGNKVYLVKRSGLSGVNVVNQDPDRQISFKDMVKRIKRVTASKSTVSFEEQNPKSEPQTP